MGGSIALASGATATRGSTAPDLASGGGGLWRQQRAAGQQIRCPRPLEQRWHAYPSPSTSVAAGGGGGSERRRRRRIQLPLLPFSLVFIDPGGWRSQGGGSVGRGSDRVDLPAAGDGDDGSGGSDYGELGRWRG
uniref:Uncharacterized protein n=1 Tax=Oryza punctata TaxID=4537 RepID=A0A1V1H3F1_ORYPU|nr:hypothetical protein [Oryza punctata]